MCGEQAHRRGQLGVAIADAARHTGRNRQAAYGARNVRTRDDLKPQAGSAETAIAEWPQHIGAFKGKGLVAGYLFFDRAANQFLSITIWESEEAQKRNATSPEQIHGRAEFMKHLTGAPVPSTYEVAAVVE